ncbi:MULTISPECIES: hypothetical protein [Streptomyces]|jgi:hypothetical protein|uniref:Uncharacterized protein n=1 Tax=Streptomyces odorifer TaxID=53450 RepID=A0A7Y6F5G0_9ACTN|nr:MULTISPECIES: hypothetical protein [Streptomyces]NUV33123.1 hypothetical protein [Streptomyces sp. KAI-27]NUV49841.1 hypothetical protein [Streptomyces sp. CAI-78]MBL0780464.1 hypothetical protein [Streptomyces albidoflavus]MBL0803882.1 hypothetical protein [Streptomyces albidoflavus]MBV1953012.1 hypothetical protein [Streptomyces sp. BV333]
MNIDWAALGSVFGVSLVVTVALVGFFTLGIVGLSKAASGAQGGGSGVAAKAGGYLCFALCAAAVAYGIYIIVA